MGSVTERVVRLAHPNVNEFCGAMTDPLTRIRRGAIILVGFTALTIVLHHSLTERPWLESVHWFVITIATVGYGEKSIEPPSVQLFTIFVILVGISLAAYTFGGFLHLLAQGEIESALGERRMSREISHLSSHTIVCGFGRLGKTLADELAENRLPLVVVDHDIDRITEASELGYLFVQGDATNEEVLEKSGVCRAKTLIVALDQDANSVFLTLTARNLNSKLHIIARGEQPSTEKKLLQAGADRVVLPAVLGARRIAAMVSRPHAAELMDLMIDRSQLNADLEEFTVSPKSLYAGKSIRDTGTRARHRLLIIGIRRADGSMIFNPDADFVVQVGDTAIVMGKHEDIQSFRDEQRL